MVLALMRWAMNCSACGGIIRSFSETWYQQGSFLQPALVTCPSKQDTESGFCVAAIIKASVGSTSPQKFSANISRSIQRNPYLSGRMAAAPGGATGAPDDKMARLSPLSKAKPAIYTRPATFGQNCTDSVM